MKEITVEELKELFDNDTDFQLIDVREKYEYDKSNLNGLHIPMSKIIERMDEIDKHKKVIIHCHSGYRSLKTVVYLEQNYHFNNLYNLKGGLIAWKKNIDPGFPL
jgi:sulfur-carrier protein adenylyltransferase/sulfurtransferase